MDFSISFLRCENFSESSTRHFQVTITSATHQQLSFSTARCFVRFMICSNWNCSLKILIKCKFSLVFRSKSQINHFCYFIFHFLRVIKVYVQVFGFSVKIFLAFKIFTPKMSFYRTVSSGTNTWRFLSSSIN